jgi:hypothetical protein
MKSVLCFLKLLYVFNVFEKSEKLKLKTIIELVSKHSQCPIVHCLNNTIN